jgi:hypothetical protein
MVALLVTLASCAAPYLTLHDAADPKLLQKLRLTQREWDEIQQIMKTDRLARGLRPLQWGRNGLGYVEVWLAKSGSAAPALSGPVLFFRNDRGHWYLLREMSEWQRGS